MARVLVVDDEPAVRRALERALKLDSYDVTLAEDGEQALDALTREPVDAVVLDVMMPRLDGLEVCRRMRLGAGDRTPVLMLTARDAIDDRVQGLDVGADDYLVKPFALRELQARLRALLRRSGEGAEGGEVLRYGDLVLDPVAHEVHRGERLIELSKTEFLLLELFLRHPRQVLTRSTIFENVWGYDFGPTSNALGVYMGYLRRKTEAGGESRLLHTVRGVGYVLRELGRIAVSLRKRLSLAAAVAVGIAVCAAAGVCYLVVRNQLSGQIDAALRAQATAVQHGDFRALGQSLAAIPASACGPAPYQQIVGSDGRRYVQQGNIALPVDSTVRRIAVSETGTEMTDVNVGENHLRVFTFAIPGEQIGINGNFETVAFQLARPLNQMDHTLSMLRLILTVLILGGIGAAFVLGGLAADRVLAPLSEVTETAQHIGETDDISGRLVVHADDEVGQLATRFNAMLDRLESSRAALDNSVRSQRQLVADASHELRTPVTSLRTNIEVLLAGGALDEDDRERLLADVVEQSEELSALVSDLIELARGDLPPSGIDEVRLDRVVEESLARARRNSPGLTFSASLEPVVVDGLPERLERAVNNLLDNAARHSPPGGPIEVIVDTDGVRVRDHGTGIAEEDLAHVFDRFYRGVNSRGTQGSGLGLAIVRQVAEQHGGSVSAANAPDGGAEFRLHLPVVSSDPDPEDDSEAQRPGTLWSRAPG